ncbi:MAG: response regulator [Gammaproteobacteria bacterium]|nr:response regulator [Gammaproteobacteria bacterium]
MVLIVDDNEQNLTLLSILLKKIECRFDISKDGLDALAKVESGQYSLVMTDIRMPLMDGCVLCENIKKKHPKLPVIAITAKALPGDKEEILSHGFDGYIEKPIALEQFWEQVLKFVALEESIPG